MMSDDHQRKALAHIDRFLNRKPCPSCGEVADWDLVPYVQHLPTTDFPETSAPKWRVFAATCRHCSFAMMYDAARVGLDD